MTSSHTWLDSYGNTVSVSWMNITTFIVVVRMASSLIDEKFRRKNIFFWFLLFSFSKPFSDFSKMPADTPIVSAGCHSEKQPSTTLSAVIDEPQSIQISLINSKMTWGSGWVRSCDMHLDSQLSHFTRNSNYSLNEDDQFKVSSNTTAWTLVLSFQLWCATYPSTVFCKNHCFTSLLPLYCNDVWLPIHTVSGLLVGKSNQ